jgi:hypothetical protein
MPTYCNNKWSRLFQQFLGDQQLIADAYCPFMRNFVLHDARIEECVPSSLESTALYVLFSFCISAGLIGHVTSIRFHNDSSSVGSLIFSSQGFTLPSSSQQEVGAGCSHQRHQPRLVYLEISRFWRTSSSGHFVDTTCRGHCKLRRILLIRIHGS